MPPDPSVRSSEQEASGEGRSDDPFGMEGSYFQERRVAVTARPVPFHLGIRALRPPW
jgi:hypothetical protein